MTDIGGMRGVKFEGLGRFLFQHSDYALKWDTEHSGFEKPLSHCQSITSPSALSTSPPLSGLLPLSQTSLPSYN